MAANSAAWFAVPCVPEAMTPGVATFFRLRTILPIISRVGTDGLNEWGGSVIRFLPYGFGRVHL